LLALGSNRLGRLGESLGLLTVESRRSYLAQLLFQCDVDAE
jgi:hypothetical protein